jgi:hypothetical protein
MPTAEQYRRRAEECQQIAIETSDEFEREALLRLAAQWARLAEHKGRKETDQG